MLLLQILTFAATTPTGTIWILACVMFVTVVVFKVVDTVLILKVVDIDPQGSSVLWFL